MTELVLDGAGPTPTATVTPTRTPKPTTRRLPTGLRLTKARLTRHAVRVRGALARKATGTVALRVVVRLPGEKVVKRKSVPVRSGRFRGAVRLPVRARGALRARLKASYAGDRQYRPRVVRRTLQR